MPMPEVWSLMEDYLYFTKKAFHLKIYQFVLMSNHFHMLASAPEQNLGKAMQYFLGQTSRRIAKGTNRLNHVWTAHYYRCEIESLHYYYNAYKYFYRNPVTANVCNRVEDYPWSTLPGLIGQRKLIIPVEDDLTLFSNVEGTLSWLNDEPKAGYNEAMRRGLKKGKFRIAKDRYTKKPHPLEEELL